MAAIKDHDMVATDGVIRSGRFGTVPYDGLIIDLDGVVWKGGHPIDGAAEAIARLRRRGMRILFMTNDPQSSRQRQAARLSAIGIPATEADVLTAATATARLLASYEHQTARTAYVVGSAALQDEIRDAGWEQLPAAEARRAEVVVVGGHEGFNYLELRSATTAVLNGAALFATGRDAVYPTRDGLWPATGAIVAAVETATGTAAITVGKPERYMFDIARGVLAECRHVAVIGDHLVADILGAKRAGLAAILVLTGTSDSGDLATAAVQPDAVFPSLAAFAENPSTGVGRT